MTTTEPTKTKATIKVSGTCPVKLELLGDGRREVRRAGCPRAIPGSTTSRPSPAGVPVSPGDRVKRRRDGTLGEVLELRGDELVVLVEGERRTWSRGTVVPVLVSHPPRGLQSVSDKVRAAVRLVREGEARTAVAALYGVRVETVTQWVAQVRAAEEDDRNRRTG